jgi:2-oxoisovalerate dehydrogenase E1 component
MVPLALADECQGRPTTMKPAPTNRLDAETQKRLLARMLLIREFEERSHKLFLDGIVKGTAHSSVGQEAIAVAACAALRPSDFIVSHHRGHGHCLGKGAKPDLMMAELLGKAEGYCKGLGGSMHIADLELNILGANGIVGAGMGIGTGAALSARLRGTDDVCVAFFGDGGANEGIFHEALNFAGIRRLPIIFFCENNQYALSTPTGYSTAGGSIAARAAGYGIPGHAIDGNDAEAVYFAVVDAIERARAGEGPSLIEAATYRWGQHSMRANLPSTRPEEEEAAWKARCPILRTVLRLRELGALPEDEEQQLREEAVRRIDEAVAFAQAAAEPTVELFTSAVSPRLPETGPEPAPGTREATFVEAINEALRQTMEADEAVFVIGEDVGVIGGIFGATRGLIERFGAERVIDTPISEAIIASAAMGAAVTGRRPVVEIQIFDFVTHMMDAIVNQAAKFRFMLGGWAKVPIVFRGPQGGGIRLAAQHSQSLEAWFVHIPGLVVIAPSTPYDAKGLLAAAIRHDGPVMFLEHKMLYLGAAGPVPEDPYILPIGVAAVRREGRDVTVVATQAMVERALSAARQLEREGIDVEVIDPRTLKPLDTETIVASVKKTNRLVIVHEAVKTGGFGAEVSAAVHEQAFDWLDAPIARVGALDVPMPYNDRLEREVIPSQERLIEAIRAVCYRETRAAAE